MLRELSAGGQPGAGAGAVGPALGRGRRWRRWTPARPTSSPSRSRWTSCWRGCARCFGAAARRPRRSPAASADLEFTLDGRSRTLCWGDGRTLSLSEREFGLLEYLVRSPNQTVSRERILNAVWEYQFDPRSNVVDVYVGRLRRKLHPAIRIETVRGGGYRLLTG